jgi:hypothetical protein
VKVHQKSVSQGTAIRNQESSQLLAFPPSDLSADSSAISWLREDRFPRTPFPATVRVADDSPGAGNFESYRSAYPSLHSPRGRLH